MEYAIILYGSRYGSTERYARRAAELTGLPVQSYERAGDLSGYSAVVYFGALYAGGVLGLKDALRALPRSSRLILVTVGLADPCDPGNVENIRRSIAGQVPKDVLARTELFHLRGGIDYARLRLPHRAMMGLLVRKAKGLPKEEQTAEVRAMLETYGKSVDFYDETTLGRILRSVRELERPAADRAPGDSVAAQ